MVEAPDLVLSGNRLVAARERRGFTQRQLSRESHVTLSSIQGYEQEKRGMRNPSLTVLGRLMRALRCQLDDLVET